MNNIGFMYSQGHGVEQNDELSLDWYRKAAEGGHFGARFNLGVRYVYGRGVEQDYPVAHMWFSIAQQNCTPVENERAKKVKESLEGTMSPAELERARQLYQSWENNRDAPAN